MPHSAKHELIQADLDTITAAQHAVGNDTLAARAWTSVSTIQRTLRGQGGYDSARLALLLTSRDVLRERGKVVPVGTVDALAKLYAVGTENATVTPRSEPATATATAKARKPRAKKSESTPPDSASSEPAAA